MANYDIVILLDLAAPITKTVKADRYEHNERGYLIFYKRDNGEPVATFKTWDYVNKAEEPPP